MKNFSPLMTLVMLIPVTTLHGEISSWERWNSTSAQASRKDHGWIEGLLGKAERMIFAPIIEQFRKDGEGLDLAALGKAAIELRPSIHSELPEFECGLLELGAFLCFRPPTDMQMVQRVFPDRGAFSEGNTSEADADPHNFLNFVLCQIGWHAVRDGWVICIAENEIASGDGIFSWVDPAHFPPMLDPGRIALPDALGVKGWYDLDEKLHSKVGADRLWFVLSRDLEALRANAPSKAGPKHRTERQRESRAAGALQEFHIAHTEGRLLKSDTLSVLEAAGFSKKAAMRIWDDGAPKEWKAHGALKGSTIRLEPDDFSVTLSGFV